VIAGHIAGVTAQHPSRGEPGGGVEAELVLTSVALQERGADTPARASEATTRPALVARGFGRPPRLKPVDLEVAAGEVVAIFGLVGAGRTRLANALFGVEAATTGELEVLGRQVTIRQPADAIRAGLGYLGESRSIGLVPAFSVAENITLASLRQVRRGTRLSRRRERRVGEHFIERLNMRVSGPGQRTDTLSGGNQQKVLLARSLYSNAKVLVLDDPTRGIDVGAKEEVFGLVRELAEDGVAVLYLTSEIKEARALADRLLVMSNGALVEELDADASDDEVMVAAGGVRG
jgi:ABC-type sugar transport system ATPase subunit